MRLLLKLSGPDLPPDYPTSRQIDEHGATVGRGNDNDLVLPDPNRHLSRRQCVIDFYDGAFVLTDTSTNGVFVNHTEERLPRNESVTLHDGDRLHLGTYAIDVEIYDDDAADAAAGVGGYGDHGGDEFDEHLRPMTDQARGSYGRSSTFDEDVYLDEDNPLARDADLPGGAPEVFGTPSYSDGLADDRDLLDDFPDNPRDATGLDGAAADDPLFDDDARDDWQGNTRSHHRPAEHDYMPVPKIGGHDQPGAGIIPADWDDDGSGQAGARPGDTSSNYIPQDEFDDLLEGIGVGPSDAPPAARPAVVSPKPPPPRDPQPPRRRRAAAPPRGEPPVDRRGRSQPSAPPESDDFDDLINLGAPIGEVADADARPGPDPDPRSAAATTSKRFDDFSENTNNDLPPDAGGQGPGRPAWADEPASWSAPQADLEAVDVALEAFLQGAGLRDQDVTGLDPIAFMRLIGATYREMVQGLISSLQARAELKKEFRIERTMISARDNNPLKFESDIESALKTLMFTDTDGLKPPVEAVREAFADLQSHAVAMLNGVEEALTHLLERFDPRALEAQLTRQSMLDGILPASRKARYWELYEQCYREIADEAEDDFHSFFGNAFANAYQKTQE